MSLGALASSLDRSQLDQLLNRQAQANTYARAAAAKDPSATTAATATAAGDKVELSGQAPKPLPLTLVRDAVRVAGKIGSGQTLTDDELARMKTDPAFAASTAMFSLSSKASLLDAWTGNAAKPSLEDLLAQYSGQWPEEVDTPAPSDLADLAKRLTQRLSGTDGEADGAQMQARRRELLDLLRGADYAALADAFAG